MKHCFQEVYRGRKVLVTGHTGFKGSWLSLWLKELGAEVVGYSLSPPTIPNLFEACALENTLTHIHGDIRNYDLFTKVLQEHQPEIIFHLAAQPLVLYSYDHPRETFDVNVQGSVNIMEAARHCPSVNALLMITTDKVYENKEWLWGYRESDRLGGKDPYSASKAMAELAVNAYRDAYFKDTPCVATARAGNVIGGGDFAENRLIPDTIKALMARSPVEVRNPASVRPWLHVLDPLSGYLWLGAKLLTEGKEYAEAWNFGPQDSQMVPCASMVEKAIELWGDGDWINSSSEPKPKEMHLLQLNSEKASRKLLWKPSYSWEEALESTVYWFKQYEKQNCNSISSVCVEQIANYTVKAKQLNLPWATTRAPQKQQRITHGIY